MFTPQRSWPKPTLGGNGVFSMREMTSSSWGFSLSCWSFRGTSCEMYSFISTLAASACAWSSALSPYEVNG